MNGEVMAGQKTKGEMEAAIGEALVNELLALTGHGPKKWRVYIQENTILFVAYEILTKAEHAIAVNQTDIVKQFRAALIEAARPRLCGDVQAITGCSVGSFLSDINAVTGDRVIVFLLGDNPQFRA